MSAPSPPPCRVLRVDKQALATVRGALCGPRRLGEGTDTIPFLLAISVISTGNPCFWQRRTDLYHHLFMFYTLLAKT